MTDTPILGIEKSASGKENGFTFSCQAQGCYMQFASCIARLGALDAPGVRVPEDWKACAQHRRANQCQAHKMREEELLAGRSIYFSPRGAISRLVDKAREWVNPWSKPKTPAKPKGDGVDALARVEGLDAAVALPKPEHGPMHTHAAPIPKPVAAVAIVALPGETPLQMARRLAAMKGTT